MFSTEGTFTLRIFRLLLAHRISVFCTRVFLLLLVIVIVIVIESRLHGVSPEKDPDYDYDYDYEQPKKGRKNLRCAHERGVCDKKVT